MRCSPARLVLASASLAVGLLAPAVRADDSLESHAGANPGHSRRVPPAAARLGPVPAGHERRRARPTVRERQGEPCGHGPASRPTLRRRPARPDGGREPALRGGARRVARAGAPARDPEPRSRERPLPRPARPQPARRPDRSAQRHRESSPGGSPVPPTAPASGPRRCTCTGAPRTARPPVLPTPTRRGTTASPASPPAPTTSRPTTSTATSTRRGTTSPATRAATRSPWARAIAVTDGSTTANINLALDRWRADHGHGGELPPPLPRSRGSTWTVHNASESPRHVRLHERRRRLRQLRRARLGDVTTS